MPECHDPNRARSPGTVAVVELTFRAWEHSAVHTVRIGGNVPGLGNMLGIAIDQVIANLPIFLRDGDDGAFTGGPALMLAREADGACMSIDAAGAPGGDLSELLRELLVGARIVALEEAGSVSPAEGGPTRGNGGDRTRIQPRRSRRKAAAPGTTETEGGNQPWREK